MNRVASSLSIFAALFFSLAVAQAETKSENATEVQSQLMKILHERKDAMAKGDKAKWKRHISDSCIFAKNEKGVVNKMIYQVRDEDIVLKRVE